MLPNLDPNDFTLTVEQQFSLAKYKAVLEEIDDVEALKPLLLDAVRLLSVKENIIRKLIRHHGGI